MSLQEHSVLSTERRQRIDNRCGAVVQQNQWTELHGLRRRDRLCLFHLLLHCHRPGLSFQHFPMGVHSFEFSGRLLLYSQILTIIWPE